MKNWLFAVLAFFVPFAVQAQIDTAAAMTEIGHAETAIQAVGLALIGLAAVAMAIRWVKAMFF